MSVNALPENAAESSRPRNRLAWAAGQRNREIIKTIMLERAERYPLARPYTAEQMRDLLRSRGVYLAVSTTRWHIERIRDAADLEADCAAATE